MVACVWAGDEPEFVCLTVPATAMIIDAHQHFWDRSQPFEYGWLDLPIHQPIAASRLPGDLRPLLDACGVNGTILVQTQHDLRENDWALQLAEQYPWILGVVGWVDLANPLCAEQLAAASEHPKFVGVRHVVQDEPDDFIVGEHVLRGLSALESAQVPFDLLVFPRQLRHAQTLAARFPDLPIVIDHVAKPQIRLMQVSAGEPAGQNGLPPVNDPGFERQTWEQELRGAAAHENVFCKLSGLVTEANWTQWTVDQLRPVFEIALDAFGPQRCMFGSDWPVCELAAGYAEIHAAATELLADCSPSAQAEIFGGTAARFYGLG